MSRPARTTDPAAAAAEAAARCTEAGIGSPVVVENGDPAGLVSTDDVARHVPQVLHRRRTGVPPGGDAGYRVRQETSYGNPDWAFECRCRSERSVSVGDRVTAVCEVVESLGRDRYELTTDVFASDPGDGGEREQVIEGGAAVLADEPAEAGHVEVEALPDRRGAGAASVALPETCHQEARRSQHTTGVSTGSPSGRVADRGPIPEGVIPDAGDERRVTDRITIDDDNPRYWRYGGERVLLLGGSDTDSLFQWAGDGLENHLDRLVAAGGNYVRNTMSDRRRDDQGGGEGESKKAGSVYAFDTTTDGRYDLTRWNEEYWTRLETFLEETQRRDVVVELTLWDQHDLAGDRWEAHPWNPANNVAYSAAESGLESSADFFAAVADGNDTVTRFQERFVRRVLDTSLGYGHVVYNISNEGWAGLEWENEWCDVIHDEAASRDLEVHVANMNMSPRISFDKALADPDRYSFVEVSQHNQDAVGKTGQDHWDDLLTWRLALSETTGPRPLNNVKIYGAEGGHIHAGDAEAAVDRMWRAVLAGCAAARFHRRVGDDNWGIGLNDRARSAIRSLRVLEGAVDLTEAVPRNDLLLERDPNESYCVALPEDRYVVYVPDGASATIDLYSLSDDRHAEWLDVRTGEWRPGGDGRRVEVDGTGGGEPVELAPPDDGRWTVVFTN